MPISAPGDLPDPEINESLLHWQAGSLPLSHLGSPSVRYGLSIECDIEDRLSHKSTPGTAVCDSCQLGDGWVHTGQVQLCSLWHLFTVLGSAALLEKAMATHSSTLAWKIPWMEEPDRLKSMGLLGVGHC